MAASCASLSEVERLYSHASRGRFGALWRRAAWDTCPSGALGRNLLPFLWGIEDTPGFIRHHV